MPKVSVCIPIHNMQNKDFFLNRALDSVRKQTMQDFEIVITEKGKMAENTNAAIKEAKGELIKILYMDDYLYHEDALKMIVENFKGDWLVTGCIHDKGDGRVFNPHYPKWNDDMKEGVNTIGSPSVLTIKNNKPLLFDERMSWMLDCDYYVRLHKKFGPPTILTSALTAIGIGDHQMTNILTTTEKVMEKDLILEKHGRQI